MKIDFIKKDKINDNTSVFKEDYEKAILLIADLNTDIDIQEITSLAHTAGAVINKTFIQKLKQVNPATIFGIGKLEEIKTYVEENDIEVAIFDGELSPSQTINISDSISCKVIDRTTLILDIFAKNALSNEGKLQVELAQLKYIYPRLRGKGAQLSRLGGGIGTRGPGETKLETDRRHIRRRINYLETQIEKLKETKKLQKIKRIKNSIKTVALVGYTNTGKSTLMNALTDSNVLAENKLFATLETKVSKLKLDNIEVLLVDTVGFIKNLPTKIIEAFKSTLDTAVEADLILNVCDASGNYLEQLETTQSILKELNCQSEILTIYNKCDTLQDNPFPSDAILISAKNNLGLDKLKSIIEDKLFDDFTSISFKTSFTEYNNVIKLKKYCENYAETFTEDNLIIKAVVPKKYLYLFKKYINNP